MFSKSDLLIYTYETKPRLLRSYEIWGENMTGKKRGPECRAAAPVRLYAGREREHTDFRAGTHCTRPSDCAHMLVPPLRAWPGKCLA